LAPWAVKRPATRQELGSVVKTKEPFVYREMGWMSSEQIRVIVFVVVHPREVLPLSPYQT